jgi:uncharacterized Ntn-hydrolase superfamily protein
MKKIENEKEELFETEGESEEWIALERDYYYAKARVDVITDVVNTVRRAAKAAQATLDEARLGGGIGSYDKRWIDEKIEKFNGYSNETKKFDALKNLEDDLEFDMISFQKQKESREKNGQEITDKFVKKVLKAQYKYEYVSETLGPDSPAK